MIVKCIIILNLLFNCKIIKSVMAYIENKNKGIYLYPVTTQKQNCYLYDRKLISFWNTKTNLQVNFN